MLWVIIHFLLSGEFCYHITSIIPCKNHQIIYARILNSGIIILI